MLQARSVRSPLLMALAVAGIAGGQASISQAVEKQSKAGVWQPTGDGTHITLWPEGTVLAEPDTGDHPEETGTGSTLVAGRMWHWVIPGEALFNRLLTSGTGRTAAAVA